MPKLTFTNNFSSTLAAQLTPASTTLTLAAGGGAALTPIPAGSITRLTLVGTPSEILEISAIAGDVLTISGSETARSQTWPIGTPVECRVTAKSANTELQTRLNLLSGDVTLQAGDNTTVNTAGSTVTVAVPSSGITAIADAEIAALIGSVNAGIRMNSPNDTTQLAVTVVGTAMTVYDSLGNAAALVTKLTGQASPAQGVSYPALASTAFAGVDAGVPTGKLQVSSYAWAGAAGINLSVNFAAGVTNAQILALFAPGGTGVGSGRVYAGSSALGNFTFQPAPRAAISAIAAISLTTTGTDGAATLTGGVLNIPQWLRSPQASSNWVSGLNAGIAISGATGYNSMFGAYSGRTLTIGSYNSFFGNAAGEMTLGGSFNTAVGALSLTRNTGGGKNLALGYDALSQNTTANNVVGVGGWNGDNQNARVVLSDGDGNICFYAQTPYLTSTVRCVLLNGRTSQLSGGGLEVVGNAVWQIPTVAPTMGADTDTTLWLNGSVPTMRRRAGTVTTDYPLSGTPSDYVRSAPYGYPGQTVNIANTLGSITLGGNGDNSVAVIGSVETYGTPVNTQLSTAGIDAGKLSGGLYYTAVGGTGAGGTLRISADLTTGAYQSVTATTIFGNASYALKAVVNDDSNNIWAIGESVGNYILVRVIVGASATAALSYERSNSFTVQDGGGSFLTDIFAFDVFPSNNTFYIALSGSSILATSQNVVYFGTGSGRGTGSLTVGNMTVASTGLVPAGLTLPVFLLFIADVNTVYACIGGGGHVYRWTSASAAWAQIYYNSATGNQPQAGFLDAAANRLAFSMQNGITIDLNVQSLVYQQFAALPGTFTIWGLWDDAGLLNLLIDMTPTGGTRGQYWVTTSHTGLLNVSGDVQVGRYLTNSSGNPPNAGSAYVTDSVGALALAVPTETNQILLSRLNAAPVFGYAAASGFACFRLTETISTTGAGIFSVGGTKNGALTQVFNNLGITPPASGSGAFQVPPGTYKVAVNAQFTSTVSGSEIAIATIGTNNGVVGSGGATVLYLTASKIQSGTDNLGVSGEMVMVFSTAVNIYVSYFFGAVNGASIGQITTGNDFQLMFTRIS